MTKIELAKDLRTFAGILENWNGNVINTHLIHGLATECRSKSNGWGYELVESAPVVFQNIQMPNNSFPTNAKKVKVKLTINIKGREKPNSDEDSISELDVKFMIDAESYLCSWHLDKVKESNEQVVMYSHPHYHLNFGGNYMRKSGKSFGDLLLLPTPRIVHPPMDIVISVDFIIKNFYTIEQHRDLTESPAYKKVMSNASERFFKPYIQGFYSKWDASMTLSNLPVSSIHPSL